MINDPACICHMTLDRVKGHPRSQGSKRSLLPKTHQVLRIMEHGPVTHVYTSPWPTLQRLLDHFFIWGHLGSQGSNIWSESKYLRKIHICHVQYSTLISSAHMEAHWPLLPGLTKIWGQRSFKLISGACKNGVKWAYLAISEHLEEQAGPS